MSELLYGDKECGICKGAGGWRQGGEWHACEICCGFGYEPTELGKAVWQTALRAVEAMRQRTGEDGFHR